MGIVLWIIPTSILAQNTPLAKPEQISHPGMMSRLRTLYSFDLNRFDAKKNVLESRRIELSSLPKDTKVDLDPDYLNSIIFNTNTSYMALASQGKCNFYASLLSDLLLNREGPIRNVYIQYKDDKGENISASVTKSDFINQVIFKECPKIQPIVSMFQLRTIDKAIKATNFEIPSTPAQCENIYYTWVQDPKSPYWCQIEKIIEEYNPLNKNSQTKPTDKSVLNMAKLLVNKLGPDRLELLTNFCGNADNQKNFCSVTFSSNFFSRVADKSRSDIYIKDICQEYLGKLSWSNPVVRECVTVLKRNPDACMWGSIENSGISPRPRCDQLSLALNYSPLWVEYNDCPANSDSLSTTNVSRLLLNFDKPAIQPLQGPCSVISAATVFDFNRKYDNENIWSAGVCYLDKIEQKDKCLPAFYGEYASSPSSITKVIEEVLKKTKGADRNVTCKMIASSDWNPQLLEYKYGCFIVYDPNNCGIASCQSSIFYNEQEVKGIKIKSQLAFDYFPNSIANEKFSQTFLLQKDAQKKTKSMHSLPRLQEFFKENAKGIVHGIGCAEDLLPGFFKKYALNQCSPLPFVIDGLIKNGDRTGLVIRSAVDNIHAPRIISWSQIFSAVKTYQQHQPLKQWTLHAIY